MLAHQHGTNIPNEELEGKVLRHERIINGKINQIKENRDQFYTVFRR